ncbi:MAG: hypothetical protein WD995_04225 [Gemmatimonadota bacterium]
MGGAVGLGVLPSTMFAKARPEDFSRSGEEEKSRDQGGLGPADEHRILLWLKRFTKTGHPAQGRPYFMKKP